MLSNTFTNMKNSSVTNWMKIILAIDCVGQDLDNHLMARASESSVFMLDKEKKDPISVSKRF